MMLSRCCHGVPRNKLLERDPTLADLISLALVGLLGLDALVVHLCRLLQDGVVTWVVFGMTKADEFIGTIKNHKPPFV